MASPELSSLYQHSALSGLLAPQAFTQGMILAVASSPEIPLPEQWMPWVLQVTDTSTTPNNDELHVIATALMQTLADTLAAMRDGNILSPPALATPTQVPTELAQWCQGFLFGHQQLEPVWQRAWQYSAESITEAEQRLQRCLRLTTTLADFALAKQQRDPLQGERLTAALPQLVAQLPAVLNDYVQLANALAQGLPQQFETFTAPGS